MARQVTGQGDGRARNAPGAGPDRLSELSLLLALYDAMVLAMQRRGHLLRKTFKNVRLDVGDTLLMLVDEDAVPRLRTDDRWPGRAQRAAAERHESRRKAPFAVGHPDQRWSRCPASAWLPIVVSRPVYGCALAMALRRLLHGFKDVYEVMDWKVIVLLGAVLPLGIAIEKTGLSLRLVDINGMENWSAGTGRCCAVVAGISAHGAAHRSHGAQPVGRPDGRHCRIGGAYHPRRRTVPFVVAVAFAAATSFATPVGYPTNTIGVLPRRRSYRFTDFLKVGIPLILIFCAILSMYLIPQQFWPFHPGALGH